MRVTTNGIPLKDAARSMGITERQLRQHLASIHAIEQTQFGWAAHEAFRQRGLLYTETRQAFLRTYTGPSIRRLYTVVLITGEGLVWLQQQLQPVDPTQKTA
jgi:hypothetical protein